VDDAGVDAAETPVHHRRARAGLERISTLRLVGIEAESRIDFLLSGCP
jgi:hypothetical protein